MGALEMKGRTTGILILFCAALFSEGCAVVPPFRAHPAFEARAKEIRTVAIMSPRVEVFQLDAGGVKEKMDEWSAQAKKNIIAAIEEELKDRPRFLLKSVSEDSISEEVKSDLEETYALFNAVNLSVIMHTYSPPSPPELIFKEKREDFDYSLGQEVQGLTGGLSDGLLLVKGVDHIWTEGRKALQALGVLLGVGAAVGTGAVIIPVLGGATEINVALVEGGTGSILWYNRVARGAGTDLRSPESAASLVKELLKDFPR